MNLHFLGTAGYHPNNRRQTSCLMIPEAGVILDAGTGFFRARDLIQTSELHIFLSHAHLDHCVGLTYFLDVLYEKDMQEIVVSGAAEKLTAIRERLFYELLFPMQPPFRWNPIGSDPVSISLGGTVQPFELSHPGGSLGYRLDWPGKSLAYVTDTTAQGKVSEYLPFIQGVDLLVHECNFPDGHQQLAAETGHSCLTPVAELARAAQVGLLVLTHLNALDESDAPLDLNSAKKIFDNTLVAEDWMQVEF